MLVANQRPIVPDSLIVVGIDVAETRRTSTEVGLPMVVVDTFPISGLAVAQRGTVGNKVLIDFSGTTGFFVQAVLVGVLSVPVLVVLVVVDNLSVSIGGTAVLVGTVGLFLIMQKIRIIGGFLNSTRFHYNGNIIRNGCYQGRCG